MALTRSQAGLAGRAMGYCAALGPNELITAGDGGFTDGDVGLTGGCGEAAFDSGLIKTAIGIVKRWGVKF